MSSLKKILSGEKKYLKKLEKKADLILSLEEKYKNKGNADLSKCFQNTNKIEESYAIIREMAYRILGLKAYKVQLMGALVLNNGDIAEMKTGEGKTLTSLFPIAYNALTHRGVHVITPNEYLAKRDKEYLQPVYESLGLSIGLNMSNLSSSEKREAYNADITYSVHSEIGFDYLRDNMVYQAEEKVQRPFNFALIDEVDSVLLDEANTPLIISGNSNEDDTLYTKADKFVKTLQTTQYTHDIEENTITLNSFGIKKAEKYFKLVNLFDIDNLPLLHHINQALKANFTMMKDVDYMVFSEEEQPIQIIDKFTGRIMKGRQFSDGLHQALEAKENVTLTKETQTKATITYQNLFRLYKKISGMTGTAKTDEDEFLKVYNMKVIEIPTNVPCIRIDDNDAVYSTNKYKYEAIVKQIINFHEKGRPILIGTVSVENSELLSKYLTAAKIPHNVLNAKNHAKEAEIIEKAGQRGAVTIATHIQSTKKGVL